MSREEKLKSAAENFAASLQTCDDHELYAAEEGFVCGANFELDRIEKKFMDWMYTKLHDGYIDVSKCCIESLIVDFIKKIEE